MMLTPKGRPSAYPAGMAIALKSRRLTKFV